MPEPLRDQIVADIKRMSARVAAIDAQLQQLAGQTPEERRAFMRRMTRAIRPLAVVGLTAAVAYTWLRRRPGRTGLAAGLILGAAIVWALLPAPTPPSPDHVEPPSPTTVPAPPAPSPTPEPSTPPPDSPASSALPRSPEPPGPGTPTSPPGPGPTPSPSPRPTEDDDDEPDCAEVLPAPEIDPDDCGEELRQFVAELPPEPDTTGVEHAWRFRVSAAYPDLDE